MGYYITNVLIDTLHNLINKDCKGYLAFKRTNTLDRLKEEILNKGGQLIFDESHFIIIVLGDYIEVISNEDIYLDNRGGYKERGLFEGKRFGAIDISGISMDGTESFYAMFRRCKTKTVIFGDIDTSNVKEFNRMFEGADIDKLDLSNLNFERVYNLDWMFAGSKINILDLHGINTNNAFSFDSMFRNATIKILNISGMETSNAKVLRSMFLGCNTYTNIDISGIDMNNAVDTSDMFKNTVSKVVGVDGIRLHNVKVCTSMFENATLGSFDFSDIGLDKALYANNMFKGVKVDIPVGDKSLSSIKNEGIMTTDYFLYGSKLEGNIDMGEFNLYSGYGYREPVEMFNGCRARVTGKNFIYENEEIKKFL